MLYISHENINQINLDISSIIHIIEYTIKNKNMYSLPPKVTINTENEGFYNTMPCIISNIYSCKIVTRNILNKPSITGNIFLYDIRTSKLLTILDGIWITAMRTGAIAAITTKYLAKLDFKHISLIGLGNSIYAYMIFLLYLFDDRELYIHLLSYKDHAEKFIKRFSVNNQRLKFIIHDTIVDLFVSADVIVSGVSAQTTLFSNNIDIYKQGVLIIPIQSRGFQNCDTTFDKVIVDDDKHVQKFVNYGKFKDYYELTDVINRIKPGRLNDNERIIVYNIGLAIHDNQLGYYIYKECLKKKLGIKINITDLKEKIIV